MTISFLQTSLRWAAGLLLFSALSGAVSHDLSCDDQETECYDLMMEADLHTPNSDTACSLWNSTYYCYFSLVGNCREYILLVHSNMQNAKSKYCSHLECNRTDTICLTDPPPTESPRTTNCSTTRELPAIFPQFSPSASPNIQPLSSISSQCTLPHYLTHYRQHCSAYTLSHIQPFGDRPLLSLETCFLPGSWYLLQHEHLEVAVKGTVSNDLTFTYITEVEVTFHTHSCSPETISYVANTSSLPSSLPNVYSPFLSLTVEDGTVATLLAPWINTTIVIRKAFGYLTVVLQVPEQLSRINDVSGLCSEGCPVFTKTSLKTEVCTDLFNNASLLCVQLNQAEHLGEASSIQNVEECSYDLQVTQDVFLLSVYKAYAKDVFLLPNLSGGTSVPTTAPTTTSSSSSSSSSSPPTTTTPDPPLTPHSNTVDNENLFDSCPPSHSQILTTLTVSFTTLFITWWLR